MRKHQDRTLHGYNLQICDGSDCWDNLWPAIRPSHAEPSELINFIEACAGKGCDKYVHFFLDDYRFERIWNSPERYLGVMRRHSGCIAPDFSTYEAMPYPMQVWNVYRSRAIALFLQESGVDVIPLLTWSDEGSYEFCFDGLPIGGTYASSNVGCFDKKGNCSKEHLDGLYEGVRLVKPDVLVMYGREMKLDVPCEVRWYKNDSIRRLRATEKSARGLEARNEIESKVRKPEEVAYEAANATIRRLFGENMHK